LQTVDLPPEALELIREGRPKPRTTKMVELAEPQEASREEAVAAPAPKEGTAVRVLETEPAPAASGSGEARAPKPRQTREREVESTRAGGSVSRSFRLPVQLATELLRVATERKIGGLKPFTQEEIAAEALSLWLKKNGCVS
jgi:hypothetical protein